MKIAKSTKQRIEVIKTEASECKSKLLNLHARLSEHSGTKRIASKLERVINLLDEWQKTA